MSSDSCVGDQIRALTDLCIHSFSTAAGMSAFVRSLEAASEIGPDLPSDDVSARKMANEIAEHLVRRALVTKGFFQGILEIWPQDAAYVGDMAKLFGFKLKPIPSRNFQACQTIIIDPKASARMTIEVVSRVTGRSWKVVLSPHRLAGHAARDIFAATILGGDALATAAMALDEYRLCQGGKSFADEVVGHVIRGSLPVHIERRQRELVAGSAPSSTSRGPHPRPPESPESR